MPRQIDVQCPKCGFVEEVLKEVIFFEDEESLRNDCPQCEYPYRVELPPLINIHAQPQKEPSKFPKKIPQLTPDGILPEDVRRVFAKELFDPCSCGEHAPADLYEHEEDCHVQQHSFIRRTETSEEI